MTDISISVSDPKKTTDRFGSSYIRFVFSSFLLVKLLLREPQATTTMTLDKDSVAY
jgi:hypothetical protein